MKDSVQGDNQQATIENICWLAGLVDAEGHIGVHKRHDSSKLSHRPVMTITNGNDAIIAEAVRIMDLLGANPAVRETKKVYKYVELSSPTKIVRALKAIEPYLAEKQVLARKVILYCQGRDPNLAEQIREKRFWKPDEATGLTKNKAMSWLAGFIDGDDDWNLQE